MKNWKGWKVKLLSFLICFGILGYLVSPIHEDCHAKVNEWLGGGLATIQSTGWGLGGQMSWVIGQIPEKTWLVYLAGGLGVFICFMASWIWFRRSETLWDLSDELALFLWAIISIFYAASETILVFDPGSFQVLSVLGVITGLGIAIALYLKRIDRWFSSEEEIIHVEGKKRIFEKIAGILYFGTAVGMMTPRINAWVQDVITKGLGGQSYIPYIGWWGLESKIFFIQIPNHAWLINYAGFFVALLFFGLWFFAYKSPTLWDTQKEFAFAVWGTAELGLGITKVLGLTGFVGIVLPIALAVMVGFIYLPKLKKWITTKEIINRRLEIKKRR